MTDQTAAPAARPFRDEPTEVLQTALTLASTHAKQAARFNPAQQGPLPAVADLFRDELQHREELTMTNNQQPLTDQQPRRGDAFEAWLKAQRDENPRSSHAWFMVDCVLDRYRLHADMGVPLGEHVCEAKVVGDCECLETRLAVSRPSAPPA